MRKNFRKISDQIELNQDWQNIRKSLADFPPGYRSDKMIELLNLCRAISDLRKLKPFVSMGRLCLSHNISVEQLYAEGKQAINDDAPSLYFYEGHYVVAGYDNRDKWLFETASEAVDFVRQHPVSIPPVEDYSVPVLPAALHALTINWLAGTASVELECAQGPVWLLLTGVTWCDLIRVSSISEADAILKLEYDHRQLLIRLSSGNYISITATGLEIKKQLI